MPLIDRFQRAIRYLRISVTDRCNLRCQYCMPEKGVDLTPAERVLSYEEIARVARVATGLGITRFRLTGGEPLVRRELWRLVEMLNAIPGVEDVALSTNGILLEDQAARLAGAGLTRVNISLDSLDPERFHLITRWGDVGKVLRGLGAAFAAGLNPVKLNVVAMKGTNDLDVSALARMTLDKPVVVRFIELMPIGSANGGFFSTEKLLTMAEVKDLIVKEFGPMEPSPGMVGSGPAVYFRLRGAHGALGFITPISSIFCAQCNRLRLMTDGRLRACLSNREEVDLRTPMRSGAGDHVLAGLFAEAVRIKPERHTFHTEDLTCSISAMSQIGG